MKKRVRRRRGAALPALPADEALAALRWLVAEGRITVAHVKGALAKRDELVREIRRRLQELDGKGLRALRGRQSQSLERRRPRRRARKRPSPAQQAAWRAQGRYLAAVRRLPKAARAQVRAVREKRGMRAAIAAAKKMTK